MADYRLYDHLVSGNGFKVRLMLSLLRLPFERVELDIDRRETRTEAFLRLNPNGRIPVLRLPDGRLLWESNAILCYLADGSPYLPADRFQRGQVMQWLFFEQYSHEPNIATVRFWLTHKVEMTPDKAAALPGKQAAGFAALALMDKHLAERDWLVGDALSIADIALYAYTHVAEEGGFALAPYKSVEGWLDRVASATGGIAITDSFTTILDPELQA